LSTLSLPTRFHLRTSFQKPTCRGVPCRGADLSGAHLERADLSGADLGGADLPEARLFDADLPEADLLDADLSGADLFGADLSGADLGGADLPEADLGGADLPEADLRFDVDLSGADLGGADLSGAFLRDADLSGAELVDAQFSDIDTVETQQLSRADLEGIDLSGSELAGANLSGANVAGTDLSGANLKDADFSEYSEIESGEISVTNPTTVADVDVESMSDSFTLLSTQTELAEADLREADLEGAQFDETDLTEATLARADCEDATFVEANLNRATFENADLSGATLSQAYLYQTRLDGVQINDQTQVSTGGDIGDRDTPNACRYDSGSSPPSAGKAIDQSTVDEDTDHAEARARRARSVYSRLEELANENGFPDFKSEMFVRRQDARRELLRAQGRGLQAGFAQVQKTLFDYGESFSRIVGISGLVIGLWWVFYSVLPILETDGGRELGVQTITESPGLVYDTLLNSVFVFFTGNSVLETTSRVGEGFVVAESMIGPILVALLIFVLGRRAAR
jgi:Uncharacterized low-complexity proteins